MCSSDLDAVNIAAYLINRGPSVPMEFRLPEEVWSGKEVKFSHLKVFGSPTCAQPHHSTVVSQEWSSQS